MRLALYTCGKIAGPLGSPQVQGFFDMAPGIFEGATKATGFVAHMGQANPMGWPPALHNWAEWGEFVAPRFYDAPGGRDDETLATTLSLWESMKDLRVFTYKGLHAEALKHRKTWFVEREVPQQVLWWIEGDRTPTWREAAAKLEHLHDYGPTKAAFSMSVHFAAH
jgi:hypothetical protein